MEVPTLKQFVSGPWKAACFNRYKPSTQRRTVSALRTQLIPAFGRERMDCIGPFAVRKWFDRYSRTAPAGANRTLDILRQIFNYAIECGHASLNPTRGVRHNPRPRVTRFLSRDEVTRVYAVLDAHRGRGSGRQQAAIIRLLILTGCRKGEVVHLRWAEVHGNILRLADSKTGPRVVFLSAAARAILMRQHRNESPYVFPSLKDLSKPRSDELSLWRKVRKVAGLDDVRLHDLRHTFASHAVMHGVPLPVLCHLLGHSHDRMALRYAHVSDRELEEAAERIGILLAQAMEQAPE